MSTTTQLGDQQTCRTLKRKYVQWPSPHLVPNSPAAALPGNPNLPAAALPGSGGGAIPCTGANTGECIGLGEEQQAQGPQPIPESTVGSSPTVHGSIG